jgi:hypothetical protein
MSKQIKETPTSPSKPLTIKNSVFFAEFEAAPNGKLRIYMGRINKTVKKKDNLVKELMLEV